MVHGLQREEREEARMGELVAGVFELVEGAALAGPFVRHALQARPEEAQREEVGPGLAQEQGRQPPADPNCDTRGKLFDSVRTREPAA